MSNAYPFGVTVSAMLAAMTISGCHYSTKSSKMSPDAPRGYIVLKSFSEENYAALARGLGSNVCVTGRLSVDSMGVYYPLQPSDDGDVIDPGFSRINTGLSRVDASREGLSNHRIHTLCGLLKEATPFENCDANHCKWYSLTDAKRQRKL